jgi:hypothetical protein
MLKVDHCDKIAVIVRSKDPGMQKPCFVEMAAAEIQEGA